MTYTNLGLLYMNLGETKQADEASGKALAIFEDGYTEDPHYASALAARGRSRLREETWTPPRRPTKGTGPD